MFSLKEKVLIGLSGGPDSVALLYILSDLAIQYKLKLFIGHLNHGLRGKEALRDQRFCKLLGRALNIPVYTKNIYIKQLIKGNIGGSIEDLARKERYKFLKNTAQLIGASKIALGHTADDQAETVIMRLLRGAGTKGLSGIPPKRKLADGLWIVRPLIEAYRKDILLYLRKNKIQYVEDSSNDDPAFLRNRVRHRLLPYLSRYNPNIKKILQSSAENITAANEYLEKTAEKVFRNKVHIFRGDIIIGIVRFNALHIAIRQLLVRRIVREIEPNIQLESDIVKRILVLAGSAKGSKGIDLQKGLSVRREYEKLIFSSSKGKKNTQAYKKKLIVNSKIDITDYNISITTNLQKRNGNKFYPSKRNLTGLHKISQGRKLNFTVKLDYDSLKRPIFVRSRQKGDVIYPIGMSGAKKVKDIFIDEKVPRLYRNKVPVFTCGSQVFWIAGYRIGEKFKIKPETKRILEINVSFNTPERLAPLEADLPLTGRSPMEVAPKTR